MYFLMIGSKIQNIKVNIKTFETLTRTVQMTHANFISFKTLNRQKNVMIFQVENVRFFILLLKNVRFLLDL